MLRSSLIICFVAVVGALALATYRLSNHFKMVSNSVVQCNASHFKTHEVVIKGDRLYPIYTEAKACESLTIINSDNAIRIIAFGPHKQHQAYDRVLEKTLEPQQQLTVRLNQIGTYQFHDHIHDEVKGQFTVTPR